tara:strand:- start:146 stop:535 length:390 start_codon:yes stop_codon:yes gene_type:complete
MAVKTFGTAITINTIAIGECTSASRSGGSINEIKTTAWDSANNADTYLGGIADYGSLEITANHVIGDAGQVEIFAEVGNVAAFIITDSVATETFSAIVGVPDIGRDEDGVIVVTVSCKVTGKATSAAVV